MPKNGVCAEIGVWRGGFSQNILKWNRPRELHLIDPWMFVPSFPKRWYGGLQAKSQTDMDAIHQGVVARFASAPNVSVHRQTSHDAASAFPGDYFDWVYIDGDHSYEAVRQDLCDWSVKVKRGGFVTGDDYDWRDETGDLSVKRAVDEFVAERRIADKIVKNGQFVLKL